MLLNAKQYVLEDTVEMPTRIKWFRIKWGSSQTKWLFFPIQPCFK